jgi:hypothetical protein
MRSQPSCPRCTGPVHAPSAASDGWRCGLHGEVDPLRPAYSPSREGLSGVLRGAAVPVWLPWPLPPGWLVTGFAAAGDERSGSRGCVVALNGPNPVGGQGEMLIIAEELGVGLGARFAGLDGPDPGRDFAAGRVDASVQFGHHDFPLWHVEAPNRAAFAGEVMASWLWVVLWPDTAGMLLVEPLALRDLRDGSAVPDLPYGVMSPHLPG